MSHLSKIELEIKDIAALRKACQRLGFQLNMEQKSFKWYGTTDAKCDHTIKVPDANYEIGVLKDGNKYNLQCDFFDYRLVNKIGKDGGLLKQAYTLEKAKMEAKKKGYACKEIKTPQGIQLTITVGR